MMISGPLASLYAAIRLSLRQFDDPGHADSQLLSWSSSSIVLARAPGTLTVGRHAWPFLDALVPQKIFRPFRYGRKYIHSCSLYVCKSLDFLFLFRHAELSAPPLFAWHCLRYSKRVHLDLAFPVLLLHFSLADLYAFGSVFLSIANTMSLTTRKHFLWRTYWVMAFLEKTTGAFSSNEHN